MNNIVKSSVFLAAMSLSGVGHAMSTDTHLDEAITDACSALQLTRSMVYSDLEKNLQTGLFTAPAQRVQGFGIDDVDSYSQKDLTNLDHLSIEG